MIKKSVRKRKFAEFFCILYKYNFLKQGARNKVIYYFESMFQKTYK